MRVAVEARTLVLRAPFRAAWGELHERELLVLRLTDAEGITGAGEAAPLEPYDGVSLVRAGRALEAYRPVLEAAAEPDVDAVVAACRARDPLPHALAAVDVALWDLAARRADRPVCALLADTPDACVPVNATIAATDRAGAADAAARAAADGFGCVKVKVGVGDDAGRVAAARAAAGAEVALRLDANGAWSVPEAEAALRHLIPAGLELVEEPVHGLAALADLRGRVPVRIAMDETAAEEGALGSSAADAVCLKLGRCGGISGLLAAAVVVRASGAEPYLASALDGPLGIAAAVHAAAALGPLPACGLATLGLFAGLETSLTPVAGSLAVPLAPGLGVEAS